MSKWQSHYPDWLYRALPHLYVWVGLLILIPLPTVLTAISSAILVAAGVMVWVNRYRYRKEFKASGGSINVLDWTDGNHPSDGSLHISWSSTFECGHPVLDAQHRRLFGLGNELVSAVTERTTKADMELLMENFLGHLKHHLETESVVLMHAKASSLLNWQKKRNFLLTKAESIRENFHRNELTARELAGFVTYDVVVDHILKADLKLELMRGRTANAKRSGKRGARGTNRDPARSAPASLQAADSVWGETYFR